MIIKRKIAEQIRVSMFKGKAIIVYGPRQSGKTTMLKDLLDATEKKVISFNGDEPDIRVLFSNATSTRLKSLVGDSEIVFIDEAQRIPDIGISIKLLVDNYPDIQVIATGSSAFELTGKIKEPLTGRKYEFHLYPFSYSELAEHNGGIVERRLLHQRLVFGSYPEVVAGSDLPGDTLKLLTDSYLYKDLFLLGVIKKPPLLEKIVRALAFQIGNEVNFTELGRMVDADNETVEKYISLLERSYIVFRLPALKRNMRNEIKRGSKIYFWDNGIRNAVIGNLNETSSRTDIGALWENYFLSERRKSLMNNHSYATGYFWRTLQQQEIDYVEEQNADFSAFEIKWNPTRQARLPKPFKDNYPNSRFVVINPDNYFEWL